jgi:hypothetical protein
MPTIINSDEMILKYLEPQFEAVDQLWYKQPDRMSRKTG